MEKALNADYLLTLAFEQVLQSTPHPHPIAPRPLHPQPVPSPSFGRGQIPPARRSLLTGYIDVSYHTYQMQHPTSGQEHL